MQFVQCSNVYAEKTIERNILIINSAMCLTKFTSRLIFRNCENSLFILIIVQIQAYKTYVTYFLYFIVIIKERFCWGI